MIECGSYLQNGFGMITFKKQMKIIAKREVKQSCPELVLNINMFARSLIYSLLLISLTSLKMPGSGTAFLKCKSESGRTIFKAELQDITGVIEKAEFTVDGREVSFSYENDDEGHVIFDPKVGVFTIRISGKASEAFPNGRFIEFWAIPTSFKIISGDPTHQKYKFKAKISGTEPRKNKQLRTPEVIMNCTLDYKI